MDGPGFIPTEWSRPPCDRRVERYGQGHLDSRRVFEIVSAGGGLASSSLQQDLGWGSDTRIVQLAMRWPGEFEEGVWNDVLLGVFLRLTQAGP
jgi:hypothetical protein